jgi:hypothetical protein
VSELERKPNRRTYLPAIEALESLRLFSGSTATLLASVGALEVHPGSPVGEGLEHHGDTWDAALVGTRISDLLGSAGVEADPQASRQGVDQLERYLSTAWNRGGVDSQYRDDCTQAVFLSLLEQYGRGGFDRLMGDVGRFGIKEVLNRETADGPDFFRAVDMVKKRAQRMRVAVPLDAAGDVASFGDQDQHLWRDAIEKAIAKDLSPREADVIRATMRGESPMDIAEQWGLTPKTVSNEKSRAFHKLRASLADVYE